MPHSVRCVPSPSIVHYRAELKQRVAFEFGKIGNQIIEGEVKESDVDERVVTVNINALINALIQKTRAQIQTRSDWMEEIVSSSAEAGDVEGGPAVKPSGLSHKRDNFDLFFLF